MGLTRARVTQLLNLLKLPDAVIQELGSFRDKKRIVFHTERRLRPITRLQNTREQIDAFRRLGSQIAHSTIPHMSVVAAHRRARESQRNARG